MHLAVGGAAGDVTYDLPLNTNKMTAKGTVGDQPFDETWTFGANLTIDGHVLGADEHLVLVARNEGREWHLHGKVGAVAVDETVTFTDHAGYQQITADGTVGNTAVHHDIHHGYATSDGHSHTDATGTAGTLATDAAGDYQTLHDRIVVTTTGQQGDVAWSLSGAAVFPSPQPPPDDGGTPG